MPEHLSIPPIKIPETPPPRENTSSEAPADNSDDLPLYSSKKGVNKPEKINKATARKRNIYQKKWNETVEKLQKNICPQCGKQRNKLLIQETYLDYILNEDIIHEEDLIEEVKIIACKRCWEHIRHAQDEAVIQHKDLELKMKNKDIKILRLKLDFYSDSEGDITESECESDNETCENCEKREDSSPDDEYPENYQRGRSPTVKQTESSNADPEDERNPANESKVFNFRNLKVNLKKK
jgi:hypothetical protein